jgi:hypothetical protein
VGAVDVNVLEPEMDSRSRSGMVWRGGTNVVDREPEPELRESKLVMVLIEPVGERVIEGSGMLTERSNASLYHK